MKKLINKLSRKNRSGRGKVNYRRKYGYKGENGQSLIILALTFVAMLAFIGLVIDVGSLYVTYTQLKRAVDSAAVAAANNYKTNDSNLKGKLTESARELLALHNVTDVSTLNVYVCDDRPNIPDEFDALCPDEDAGEMPRKLAWVEATQNSPVYFLSLFGLQSIPFTTSAVGEAATVDLVLVFDTSESMASDTDCSDGTCTAGFDANNFDPTTCNNTVVDVGLGACYPMRQAKDAAKLLVANLLDGIDQVAIVEYNYDAQVVFSLNSDLGVATNAINTVGVHDDPPAVLNAWYSKTDPINGQYHVMNPIFPDDRDGDGFDHDDPECTDNWKGNPLFPGAEENVHDMWDDVTGKPCDDNNRLDAYDWDGGGDWGDIEDNVDHMPGTWEDTSLLSTCIGCGIRVGTDQLKEGGRQASLWVMVFLTDGVPNLSDTHDTYDEVPASFKYGFCGNNPSPMESFWASFCIDKNLTCNDVNPITGYCSVSDTDTTRYCIDTDATECPPDSSHVTTSWPYSVEDYARDMADAAGLLVSENADEPPGEDIIIYSIGLGTTGGAPLLRYIANIGEDGSRANDLCEGEPATVNCGNYFYAPKGAYLDQIFESIAGRIFTKISR